MEGTLYSWGGKSPTCEEKTDNGANYKACGRQQTVPVGTFRPNGYGLFDMTGNVWEWVQDNYMEDKYAGKFKILLGGSWATDKENLKIDYINYFEHYESGAQFGFRCVIDS